MEDTGYQPAVELYVRSMCPRGAHQRQEQVIERLEAMLEADRVADLSVVVWGDRITLDTVASRTDRGERILGRIDEFRRWARRENVSVSMLERVGTVESAVTDDCVEAVRLPVMCLAESVDGTLTHVTPHSDGDAVRSIEDRLTEIAARSTGEQEGDAERDGPVQNGPDAGSWRPVDWHRSSGDSSAHPDRTT